MSKKTVNQTNGITKKVYSQSIIELMETIRLMDQRISSKADDVVLTMTLAHRGEIETLQKEVNHIQSELENLQQTNIQSIHTIPIRKQKRNKSWFKLLPFVQKS